MTVYGRRRRLALAACSATCHVIKSQVTDTTSRAHSQVTPTPAPVERGCGRATLPPPQLPTACANACDCPSACSSAAFSPAPPASRSSCHALAKAKHATAMGPPTPKSASGGGASVASSAADARARAAHWAAAAGGGGAVAAWSSSGRCGWRSRAAHLHGGRGVRSGQWGGMGWGGVGWGLGRGG